MRSISDREVSNPDPSRLERPGGRGVELRPLDSTELIETVAGWLARKENFQWLDFADGATILTPAWLKIMSRSDRNVLRAFTDDNGQPIGVVALSNVNRAFRTGTLWAALGDKRYARRGYSTRAVSEMLRYGFREMGLHVINTWVVEHNPSVKIALQMKFRLVGRQRECHWIDGCPYDRLLFDLLASEYSGLEPEHE